jgi:hypothetical protein
MIPKLTLCNLTIIRKSRSNGSLRRMVHIRIKMTPMKIISTMHRRIIQPNPFFILFKAKAKKLT